jgi:hypothetical protein
MRERRRRADERLLLCTSWPVAALNLTTTSAGTRPRSFTSMPCALAHSRTSAVFSPLADPLPAAASGPAGATANPPPCPHIGRQRVTELLGMRGVQVDLIIRGIQPEPDRPLSGAAVDVIDEQGLHLLGHGCSIPPLTGELPRHLWQCPAQRADWSGRARPVGTLVLNGLPTFRPACHALSRFRRDTDPSGPVRGRHGSQTRSGRPVGETGDGDVMGRPGG